MSDDQEKLVLILERLSKEWFATGSSLRATLYALGLMSNPPLWLTADDKKFLAEMDSAFGPQQEPEAGTRCEN